MPPWGWPMLDRVVALGGQTIAVVRRLGAATLFVQQVLMHSGASVLRPRLTLREIYFAGTLSLPAIVQNQLWAEGGTFAHWNVFTPWGLAGFALFLVAAVLLSLALLFGSIVVVA